MSSPFERPEPSRALSSSASQPRSERAERLLAFFQEASFQFADGQPLTRLLARLTWLTAEAFHADQCLVLLITSAHELHVAASARPITSDRSLNVSLDRLAPLQQEQRWQELNQAVRRLLAPLFISPPVSISAALLVFEGQCIGLLACLSQHQEDQGATDDYEQEALLTVANLLAATARYHQLVLQLEEDLMRTLVQDLLNPSLSEEKRETLHSRAALLGTDLRQPHRIALLEVDRDIAMGQEKAQSFPWLAELSAFVKEQMLQAFPGTLLTLDEQHMRMTCVIQVGLHKGEQLLPTWFRSLHQSCSKRWHVYVRTGLSAELTSLAEYPAGYEQARRSLTFGKRLGLPGGVTSIRDLGVLQYLDSSLADDPTFESQELEVIKHIAAYDRRKGSDLLLTLEAYLEMHGNFARTAEHLLQITGKQVSPSTVRQRIERLSDPEVGGLDVQRCEGCWLNLQLAIKLFKLRQL